MDADLNQQHAIGWVVVEDEDWSGVNECGAIFVPDREMKFEVKDDEGWSMSQNC
jgi:hypothetical protein